jgi:hypothetical protein
MRRAALAWVALFLAVACAGNGVGAGTEILVGTDAGTGTGDGADPGSDSVPDDAPDGATETTWDAVAVPDAGQEADLYTDSVQESSLPSQLAAQVDQARYSADLAFITGERPRGSPHLLEVRQRCAQVFAASGFAVEQQELWGGANVIGTRPGTSRPEERVLLSAHYDHIQGCPGADDNASGTAAVLEAARVMGMVEWDRTLVVACWDAEEEGLLGSAAYAQDASQAGEQIVAAYILDGIGYVSHEPGSQEMPPEVALLAPAAWQEVKANGARGDFLAVLADDGTLEAARALVEHANAAGTPSYLLHIADSLKLSEEAAALRNSDHASFWEAGFPALAVSDTGPLRNHFMHCIAGPDSLDTLDLPFALGAVRGLVASAAAALQAVP